MENIYNTLKIEEITDQYDPADIEQQKGIAIVSFFLSFLFFLPIVSNKDSKFAKTVANQSLTILVAEIVLTVVNKILMHIPLIGWLIGSVISLACVAFVIIKIVDVANGKIRTLPYGFVIPAFK